jgi:hypothetical protein
MNISDERVRECIHVCKEKFGDELSTDEAREMLTRLVTLYQLLAQPLPDEAHR